MQKNQTSIAKKVACSQEKLSGGWHPPPPLPRCGRGLNISNRKCTVNRGNLEHFSASTSNNFFTNCIRAMNQRSIWGLVQRQYFCVLMKNWPLHFLVTAKNEVRSKLPRYGVTLNALQIVNYL